ncbi:Superkiller protein 3 [Teratosphaeriaceae sp. CCFEE 6253]|nr:Superkiller protein 3 [Teratosphaeriaceae sp. CCFEE 6253]
MSVKANLKAAKAALDAGDYGKAVAEAQIVIASDSQNYFAQLFLGRALEKQQDFDGAANSYQHAAKSKPDDSQAWLGLCSVYEAQGSTRVDEYREAAVRAAEVFATADDQHRCQTAIDKLTSFVKRNGTAAQYKRTLEVLLPGNTISDFLEGRIPHPSNTYTRLIEIVEEEEAQLIKREVSERRTRIGARLGQVTTDVKREVFGASQLETLYQELINWSNDDEIRRRYEEKLLDRAYDELVVLPTESKSTKLDQVLTLAEGMVIIKHPHRVAWDLVLETRDLDDLQDLDVNILREYTTLFPKSGLAMVLQAWLSSGQSPFPPPPESQSEDGPNGDPMMLTPEDRLLMVNEGLSLAAQSPLAHRLVSDYYLHLEEHESALETARTGLELSSTESGKLGMSLQNTRDALSSVLATALVQYQAPRHHTEARKLFEDILQRKPRSTPALIGLGLILEETEDYLDAIEYFTQALEQDTDNLNIGIELAWCRALSGDYSKAQNELEAFLPRLRLDDARARDLRAQVLYRVGTCIWHIDKGKTARKDRNGAYARFLTAVKTNVNFAPAYTSLGIYYADYAKDRRRARQCFQKAFELSPAETDAAERLAKSFADLRDWDIVEVIAQRVVDSGRARPPPGSKRKGISWPYSALGVVQMSKQDYSQAIVSFLAALRISPDDYESYIGLGESYHNSGRYNSALRAFTFALNPPEGTAMKMSGERWFAKYMLANVHRELGDYDEAIGGLVGVLGERPMEFGVQMSLLQTYVEEAWQCLNNGLYGQAVDSACQAITTATEVVVSRPHAFNLWKAVGDACSLFSWIGDVDHVQWESDGAGMVNGRADYTQPHFPLLAGILAYKRAIGSCAHDTHAQAVAWYNLGWAEHRACIINEAKAGRAHLRAAVRCFKRAIELEASNAEFWNAMGVATTTLSPKVAQHAFVRSLHLNELNAKVWTNLGVLYLLQNDADLAHSAFGRAQSTDPDYGHAWVGEGLVAILLGDSVEALNHFTHAFEISDSTSTITKRQYAMSSFDHLLTARSTSTNLSTLVQPVFALDQLRTQAPHDLPCSHLAALFLERVGDRLAATETLTKLCARLEAEYERTELSATLARFAQAKSDLARCQLASSDSTGAAENAETALDLSQDVDDNGLDAERRARLRLSAHLTAGLAAYSSNKLGHAISMFRTALQESDGNPDVVCLLVKVLWAHGGAEEKTVGQEQLFECVERHPDHVGCVTLLGSIAALDADEATSSAVKADLLSLRLKDGLHTNVNAELEHLLSLLDALGDAGTGEDELAVSQAAVLLRPDLVEAWTGLADLSGAAFAAEMALKSAQKVVPPTGDIETADLSKAFAGVGSIGAAQHATVLSPWEPAGWGMLVTGGS